jgi:hypothetical protein
VAAGRWPVMLFWDVLAGVAVGALLLLIGLSVLLQRAAAKRSRQRGEDPETDDREEGGECLGQASRRGRFSVSPAASRMRFT